MDWKTQITPFREIAWSMVGVAACNHVLWVRVAAIGMVGGHENA